MRSKLTSRGRRGPGYQITGLGAFDASGDAGSEQSVDGAVQTNRWDWALVKIQKNRGKFEILKGAIPQIPKANA